MRKYKKIEIKVQLGTINMHFYLRECFVCKKFPRWKIQQQYIYIYVLSYVTCKLTYYASINQNILSKII